MDFDQPCAMPKEGRMKHIGWFALTVFIAAFFTRVGLADSSEPDVRIGPSGMQSAGVPFRGLAVALSPEIVTAKLGEPVWVTVEVRNVSGSPLHPRLMSRYHDEFSITEESTGKVIPRDPHTQFGLFAGSSSGPNGRILDAGQSYFIRFRLDMMYLLEVPGTYKVLATAIRIISDNSSVPLSPSNQILLRVVR